MCMLCSQITCAELSGSKHLAASSLSLPRTSMKPPFSGSTITFCAETRTAAPCSLSDTRTQWELQMYSYPYSTFVMFACWTPKGLSHQALLTLTYLSKHGVIHRGTYCLVIYTRRYFTQICVQTIWCFFFSRTSRACRATLDAYYWKILFNSCYSSEFWGPNRLLTQLPGGGCRFHEGCAVRCEQTRKGLGIVCSSD